jgi:hypothetical protein
MVDLLGWLSIVALVAELGKQRQRTVYDLSDQDRHLPAKTL